LSFLARGCSLLLCLGCWGLGFEPRVLLSRDGFKRECSGLRAALGVVLL
jgi:hypothetical protein